MWYLQECIRFLHSWLQWGKELFSFLVKFLLQSLLCLSHQHSSTPHPPRRLCGANGSKTLQKSLTWRKIIALNMSTLSTVLEIRGCCVPWCLSPMWKKSGWQIWGMHTVLSEQESTGNALVVMLYPSYKWEAVKKGIFLEEILKPVEFCFLRSELN